MQQVLLQLWCATCLLCHPRKPDSKQASKCWNINIVAGAMLTHNEVMLFRLSQPNGLFEERQSCC